MDGSLKLSGDVSCRIIRKRRTVGSTLAAIFAFLTRLLR